jgi:plastocyanin
MSSPGGGPSVKLVTVGVDAQGNPTCSPTTVDIWSTVGDTVKWVSSGVAFLITFASSSPFAESRFSGPMASSGAIQPGATGSYKYSVQVGSKILDPDVKVHPP